MTRFLLFVIFFILTLAAEWAMGRFLGIFGVSPPLAAAFTIIWGQSDSLIPRLLRQAGAGLIIDSVSSLSFGSYTVSLIFAGITISFLRFTLSDPGGFFKKNLISTAGLFIFIVSVFTVSVPFTYLAGLITAPLSIAHIKILAAGILWAPILALIFNYLLLTLPKRLR